MNPPEEPQAAKTADRLRNEFLVTLREIDRRAHRAMDVRGLMRENGRILAVAGAGLTALVVAIIATSVALSRSRESRLTERRLRAFRRAWKNPERVAGRRPEQPRPLRLALSLVTVAAVAAGTQLVRRTLQRALPARSSSRPR